MKPRIHSILLVKDEEDIIESCLRSACAWSDFIYVYDGASVDRTWEIVCSMKSDQIIPFKQDGQVFREGLRAEVFNAYRSNAREGDWWCQLNADEFYIDQPTAFLAAVNSFEHVVWGVFINYFLTYEDVKALDFSLPIDRLLEDIRFYKANWSERRFFRHRCRLVWEDSCAWPAHLGVSSRKLIRFRHYPYRSPSQVQRRLDVRRDNRKRGFEGWEHAKELTWEEKIVSSQGLDIDLRDGNFNVDANRLPFERGGLLRRTLQHILHSSGIWP